MQPIKPGTSAETTKQIAEEYNNIGEADDIYKSYFTNGDVIPIYTKEQLEKVGSGEPVTINGKVYVCSPYAYYAIQNDLDLGGYNNETKTWVTEKAWTPLPNTFTGTLDGLGHTISGLYLAENNGIFSKLEGTVKNLEIENSYINYNPLGFTNESGKGNIESCYIKYTDSNNKIAIIPIGFKVSEKAQEQTIDEGLVIKDKDGNEFVWVPCTVDANDGSGLTLYAQDKKYNDGTIDTKQWSYQDYRDWKDEGGNIASVKKYKGFYVGRYEAGIPENAPFFGNTAGAAYTYEGRNTNAYAPVSKANNPSWNGISQTNAKEVSKKMYASSKSVESSLIDSYAWDTIVNWMEVKVPGIATDSTNYGNYVDSSMSLTDALYAEYVINFSTWDMKSIATNYKKQNLEIIARTGTGEQTLYEIATGSAEKTKVQNIYDMAGNMWEWTTEVGNHDEGETATQFAVLRGGCFNNIGSSRSLSGRYGADAFGHIHSGIGFRVVLYIK